MPNLSAILAKPEDFGFEFVTETIRVGGQGDKGTPHDVPVLVVRDLTKFDESFPGAVMDALDGSSIRVQMQGIARSWCEKRKADSDQLKSLMVQRLLGVRAPSAPRTIEVPVFVGPEGTKWETAELAAQAWQDWALSQAVQA